MKAEHVILFWIILVELSVDLGIPNAIFQRKSEAYY